MAFLLVRVRGTVSVNGKIRDTLRFLGLPRPNFASVVPSDDASYKGMVKRAKDYIAYGEVSADTLGTLLKERGRIAGDKPLTDAFVRDATGGTHNSVDDFARAVVDGNARLKDLGKNFKPFFRLHPPVGGWEPTKRHFTVGGALGYRGKDVNKLVKRMMTQPEKGLTPKQEA